MSATLRASLAGLVLVLAAIAQSGHYEGKLLVPNREVRLTVDLDRNAQQTWMGHITMTPGPSEVPLADITVNGDQVGWKLADVPQAPVFEGKWDREAGTMTGTATIGQNKAPFDVKRMGDAKVVQPPESSSLSPKFEGAWEGSLDAGGQTLRVLVNLKRGPGGKAAGTLTSLDQGAVPIPITTITQTGDRLQFSIRLIGGTFDGQISEGETEIAGTWEQNQNSLPLTLKKKPAEEPK